jgi:hypothetical protein
MSMADVVDLIKQRLRLTDADLLFDGADSSSFSMTSQGSASSSHMGNKPTATAAQVVEEALKILDLSSSENVIEDLCAVCDKLQLETGWEPLRRCTCNYTKLDEEQDKKKKRKTTGMIVPQWKCQSLSSECPAVAPRPEIQA